MIRRNTAAAAMGLAVLASGCAEERPAINRVQPYALQKSMFVGEDFLSTHDDPEFYSQATLIDVGYGASQDGLFTSTYAQPLSRIKWQITEDQLIGRIAYERIDNSDGKGLGGPVQDGVIAVAFNIEKHFDIINQYNPTTGEKLNIVDENASDRPWFEREYFRVDWSKNVAGDTTYDFDTLSMMGLYGGLKYESFKYDITDPNDPDAPQFEALEDGYFDVTVKAFAKPQLIDLSHFGWGIDAFPACYLDPDFLNGTGPAASCNPVELTIRHSFKKVEDTDYEPKHWDGLRFQAYGAFYEERKGYNRKYGMTDEEWRRFIARYNIWERSHYYDDPVAMTGAVECFTPETTPYGQEPNRDLDGNGTADECEQVTELTGTAGSQCDHFNQKCTLPYRERTPKPIVWYYTEFSDPEYFEPSAWATRDWDSAFRAAIEVARYTECNRTGGENCAEAHAIYDGQMDDHLKLKQIIAEVIACEQENGYGNCDSVAQQAGEVRNANASIVKLAQMDPMVVLCHSPVEANDHPFCTKEGDVRLPEGIAHHECADAYLDPESELYAACEAALTVRIGDLRYHQINVIPTPQTPSPWGIMVDANDPLTGEVVSASANVWSHVNDLWSAKTIDMMRYAQGELSTEEVTEADYVRDWARAAASNGGGGVAGRYDADEVRERVMSYARAGLQLDPAANSADFQAEALPELPASVLRKARMLKKDIAANVRASLDAPGQVQSRAIARARHAAGTEFEAELMTPMMQELMGVQGLAMTEGVLDSASILRAGNPSFQRQLYRLKEQALAERGSCMYQEAPTPMSLTGLADVLEAKFGQMSASDDPATQLERAERMRTFLKRRAHYAVMVHEMGHSVGLRHNFVSSSDAWGYRPQYWQLRTKNGTVTSDCTGVTRDGEDCIGPRYFDRMSQNERDNLLWMFMHSSVMDYAGEPSQDMLGLAAYDYAAARMLYGDSVAVFADDSYKADTFRGRGMIGKQDNFGGILGYSWEGENGEIHYSALNREYDLINNCRVVNPDDYKPAYWNEELDGAWHPTLDGLLVQVDGQYSVCDQQKVDYVSWKDLITTDEDELQEGGIFPRGGPTTDTNDRVRVPYGFATDRWADLGNTAVYRHDNGADTYELFDFFITQQEIGHIWDNYRRGRQTFSIRGAANRTLSRYNGKMRDSAKGLGLLKNIYRDFSLELGYNFSQFWPQIAPDFFSENILGASLAFDHFTRAFARPEHGGHYYINGDTSVLRSERDAIGNVDAADLLVDIPNGATGYLETVGIGGKPVENQLAEGRGEYDAEFTINAGSYYDKVWTPYLMAESEDNFISDSRRDFVDARYRAVSLADLFPDGFRRWLANNLTGDDQLKGMRLWADPAGRPFLDDKGFPDAPIGYVSWWGSTPRVCFPNDSTTICSTYGNEDGSEYNPDDPGFTAVIDPQVGWEQQKFLIAWTMMYLPANQQQDWIDMMRVWEMGEDADPGFDNRIEYHHPTGKVYVAKTYGTETIFGKTVQRGIAARVLEYANELMEQAYEVTDGPDLNGDGNPDWYEPVMNPNTGEPMVKFDPTISAITEDGFVDPDGSFGCNATSNANCTCEANRACMALRQYASVPFFLREAVSAYGLGNPNTKGIYD